MRAVGRVLLVLVGCCACLAAAAPVRAQGIVVDHTTTQLELIPTNWLDAARANLRIGYTHTSHGSQLVSGLQAVNTFHGSQYDFPYNSWGAEPGVFFNDYWASNLAGDLGANGDLSWRDATVTMLSSWSDRNVVMWSWCGGVSDNTVAGIQAYLDAMAGLEATYPDLLFVYMTGHLDGSGSSGNLHARNQQIRDWCLANDKILFDFADIESYDPDGATDFLALFALDSCIYDANDNGNPWDDDANWAGEWVSANPGSDLSAETSACSDCAHSHGLNCALKGRALWWLLARLAGWPGPDVVFADGFELGNTTAWSTSVPQEHPTLSCATGTHQKLP